MVGSLSIKLLKRLELPYYFTNMSSVHIKVCWEGLISRLLGTVPVGCYIAYKAPEYTGTSVFLLTGTFFFDVVDSIYDYFMYSRKCDNGYKDKIMNQTNGNLFSKIGNNKLVEISVVLALATISKILTSGWLLTINIYLDYFFFETFRFLDRIYNELLPSYLCSVTLPEKIFLKNSASWSKLRIVTVSVFVNTGRMLTGMIVAIFSGYGIPSIIFSELNKYLKIAPDPRNVTLLQYNNISEYLIFIFDNYMDYLCCSTALVFVYVVHRYWDIALLPPDALLRWLYVSTDST